jgi:hypothetical protein
MEWNLLERGTRPGRGAGKGFAVTFIVHASRGEDVQVTVRLSGAVAIAKGRSLLDEGWQVYITGPDGIRHYPATFDELQALGPTLRSEPWPVQLYRVHGGAEHRPCCFIDRIRCPAIS